ncbi:uncharacterized protein SPPG_08089 [Spizellomyces punctatus DAOM BR117]|uniref:Histone deacetylase domain-containing protein n=1 Tax=Spizellomyces punctatus (strain DAOM BR117) TaxID=645134 RepID=A0A0L0H4R3_SPIPD|nr:uncharacterized protein SPPG_08089 [Spizellomyces punctatus DAOM BR117]KNC96500.1 hypothetical protein SPPG_08089 [Spizellomyces punctatus DAOM BR117]|eukprot:XP_016604540.1 hypothetical protein SPPG_08089 [Spizellomyces punctatus DAOM BR117]
MGLTHQWLVALCMFKMNYQAFINRQINEMKVIYSEKHCLHNPPKEFELGRFVPYKECTGRVDSILSSLRARNLGEIVAPNDYGLGPIAAVHSKEFIAYLQNAYEEWVKVGGNPEGVFPDVSAVRDFANLRKWKQNPPQRNFPYSRDGGPLGRPGYYCFDMTGVIAEGTFQAAYEAAQVALTGAELLIEEKAHGIFALCRPPGHHAQRDLCGGYCFFNNAAIAVRHLIHVLKVGRVAIIDIDYHHGNGTQEIFYENSNPLYVSLHGALDYPFYWGAEDEVGENEGAGFNVNVPLKMGTQDKEYIEALQTIIDTRVKEYNPQIVVVSLGVDTYANDPIGGFFLTTPAYIQIGRALSSLRCPTLFVMEGGYAVEEIGDNVTNVLQGFENYIAACR